MRSIFNDISIRLLLIFLSCSVAGISAATEPKSLYTIELPTQIDGKALEQSALLELALQQLLVQACGSNTVLKNPAVIEALKQTDKYVSQISYKRSNPAQVGATAGQSIKVSFNEARVNQLLKTAKKPVWEKTRPLTLLWCVMDHGDGQHWLSVEQDVSVVQEVEKQLKLRAIPYLLPLYDLADTTQVSEQDIINETVEPIAAASKRYHSDVILLGHLSHKENFWKAHWTLLNGTEKVSWNVSNQELNSVLNQTAEDLALKLSGQEAASVAVVETPHNGTLSIAILGINNVDQYTKVQEYLGGIHSVKKVEVAEVQPHKTIFQVYTTSNKEKMIELIAAGSFLTESRSFGEVQENQLSYRISGG